jgi:hypothetical protein
MNGHFMVDYFTPSVFAAIVAVGFVTSAVANPKAPTDSVTITVFDDRYIVGGRSFDDLNYVEEYITGAHPHGVSLLICGANATRAFKAVVHRFRHLPVTMRLPDADERDCMSRARLVTPVQWRIGTRPFGIDDAAVERYWLDITP